MENENKEILEIVQEKQSKHIAKKLLSLTIIGILVAVIITISLMALLPKNYNFNLAEPTTISVHKSDSSSSSSGELYYKDSEQYKKIMNLYKESFKTTIFTALIHGKAGDKVSAKEGYKAVSSISAPYIEFYYETSQKLVLNGKEYKPEIISDANYIDVIIEVKDSTTLTEVNAYFLYKDTGTNRYSYVRFSTFAIQAELYDYIESL